ncbi:MFS transporter [Sciscionella marina]|uniref:MFS transporter n=1 Tax=Sciscionella marina TaxID=508770 RepID=UPI00035E9348|nr:MFS transporter [Sciscionella marina]
MGTAAETAMRRKTVVAASIGNFIDFFEFGLYGIFSAAIALNFFPGEGESSLLLTFAAFGVSFVLRPLGAVVFGHFGDRMGRRGTLAVTILGISVATFVIGALPTANTIGLAAPILLVIARVVQGFCTGGEFGGATAFMVENAPEHKRALYGSWQMFTQFAATVIATAIGTILTATLSGAALNDWGWRLPFLLTLPLGLLGLYLRLKVDETQEFKQEAGKREPASPPIVVVLREHWRTVLKIVCFCIVGTTATYMISGFWPAFLVQRAGVSQSLVFAATLIGTLALVIAVPFWAMFSDRIGRRKPFLISSSIAIAVLAVPVYYLVLAGTTASVITGYLLLNLALSVCLGSSATAMAEMFPTRVRYTGMSISYSIGVSVFGGATPLILTAVVNGTGMQLGAAFYLIATALVSLIGVLRYPETGGKSRTANTSTVKAEPQYG